MLDERDLDGANIYILSTGLFGGEKYTLLQKRCMFVGLTLDVEVTLTQAHADQATRLSGSERTNCLKRAWEHWQARSQSRTRLSATALHLRYPMLCFKVPVISHLPAVFASGPLISLFPSLPLARRSGAYSVQIISNYLHNISSAVACPLRRPSITL